MADGFLHPSEQASILRRQHLDNSRLSPTIDPSFYQHPARVQPGSPREASLLEEIALLRDEEASLLDESFETRRKRARHHWARRSRL